MIITLCNYLYMDKIMIITLYNYLYLDKIMIIALYNYIYLDKILIITLYNYLYLDKIWSGQVAQGWTRRYTHTVARNKLFVCHLLFFCLQVHIMAKHGCLIPIPFFFDWNNKQKCFFSSLLLSQGQNFHRVKMNAWEHDFTTFYS